MVKVSFLSHQNIFTPHPNMARMWKQLHLLNEKKKKKERARVTARWLNCSGNKMWGFTVECVNGNSFGQGNVNMIHKVIADMLEATGQFFTHKRTKRRPGRKRVAGMPRTIGN